MEAKSFAAVVAALCYIGGAVIYAKKIIRRDGVDPLLSTWLIFLCATVLALVTYLKDRGTTQNLLEGIVPICDVMACAFIAGTIMVYGSRKLHLKPFEHKY